MTTATITLNVGTGGDKPLIDTLSTVDGAAAPAGASTQMVKIGHGAASDFKTASASNPLPTVAYGNGLVSTANSSSATLGIGGAFTGASEDVTEFSDVRVYVFSDQASATDGLQIQQSSNGTNWDVADPYSIPAASGKVFSVGVSARFYRIVYTNGATAQAAFRLQTKFHKSFSKGSSVRPQDARTNDNDMEEMLSHLMGYNGASWDRLRSSIANGLAVDVSRVSGSVAVTGAFFQATQPVSGTFFQATQAVSGTFFQTTQPVSGAFFQATQPVSGTFFQATQPISAASLPLPAGAGTETTLAGVRTDLGTDGTTPPAVLGTGTGVRGWLRSIYEKLTGTIAVTGAFFQATQPVSMATNTPDVTDRSGRLLGTIANTAFIANAGTNLNTSALCLDATLTNHTQRYQAVTTLTTLSVANTAVTLTLPAVAAQFHYITRVEIVRVATAAVAGTAVLGYTSTNIPGAWARSAGNAIASGSTVKDVDEVLENPVKSSTVNTATTIVAPAAGAAVQVRITAYYYTAA